MEKFDSTRFLESAPNKPGVYQMFDADEQIIYIGKARNLKKRLSSYFQKNITSIKTLRLVEQISKIEVIITHSENEALILENNLIKQHRPRYNVLFRDDKSYPYIFISEEHDFPQLCLHRGAKRRKGMYFGPYPSAGAARETINLLQKVFLVRQCDDSFFKHRTRPCLQHQIKRCSAPCVKLIDKESYQRSMRHVIMFLQGKSHAVCDELINRMQQASEQKEYEQAALCRDKIANLKRVQEQQYVAREGGDVDVVALASEQGIVCVQILYIRHGQLLGNKSFFPRVPLEISTEEVLQQFISQYYFNSIKQLPQLIIVPAVLTTQPAIETVLTEQAGFSVKLQTHVRSEKARWVEMAQENAEQTLQWKINNHSHLMQRFQSLQMVLHLAEIPQRIECFDVSHSMGEATVASCVVFEQHGAVKRDYRRFNIKNIQRGDDYAALRQALTRRYQRLRKGEGKLPDVLVIDGGKGQFNIAKEVLTELQISDVFLMSIAKGPARKAGKEILYVSASEHELKLPENNLAFHLIQQVRDEAHRFAIAGHRAQRDKKRHTSSLETIPGVGASRRRNLLQQFGGLQEVKRASVEELAKVKGISRELAQKIFDALQ